MKRAIANAVLVTLVIGVLCFAAYDRQPPQIQEQQTVAVQVEADQRVEEQVTVLPDDGKAYHVSLILHDDWKKRGNERAIVRCWAVDARLKSLKSQVHWHLYTESDRHYRTVMKKSHPIIPAVVIQREDGKVHYKASGAYVPTECGPMGDVVSRIFKTRPIYILPYRRPKPCPQPEPAPVDPPDIDVDVDIDTLIPDVIPDTPAESSFPWILLVIPIIAGVLTLVFLFKREING